MSARKVIGIDIGGSHITAGIVDLASRAVIKESLLRKHVNSKSGAEEIIDAWTTVIRDLLTAYPDCEKKIGVAMPGPFNYEEGICLIKGVDKFELLFGLNIKKILTTKLNIEENAILMMNDASCFLKGEVFNGAAVGCNNVAGITLGTGLGSARFQDGKFYEGVLYSVPYKDGTTEDYLSTRWFLKQYNSSTGDTVKDVKELCTKIPGNAAVAELFAEFGKNLGHVLSNYLQIYSCDTIVVGGNIINTWQLFINETKNILDQLPRPVSIRKAMLAEEGALVGAASLWE
jgi:glucokinase